MVSYREKKVIPIGTVSELTGLSVRQIRYYEERKLVVPERSKGGTRKFSFEDVDMLVEVANKMEDGMQTYEIHKMREREKKQISKEKMREEMLKGQLNVQFNRHRPPS
ncbi:HTH-type transcriptional regulator tnrA [Chlamydia abortus]|uniref:MerR family transcriptional regulator n=1 Tax=Paenibacillus residui TaxID=629724 RepID=A0ABW3DAB8_9BACL|nr:MerR family transcriptional regulator [Paenibacillus sp. 32O-W]SHE10571.1 HTH-type transcriptional regulator tnrA [Chlamydia abortus]